MSATNNPKPKFKNSFHSSIEMNKMHRNKFNKRQVHWKLESTAKIRKKDYTSGETFYVHELEDSELTGGNFPPNDLYVQCNPYPNPRKHSNRNWQAGPKMYYGMQRAWNSLNDFVK